MKTLTLFTWGYWGWGTATDQLIRAVDAVEASRGYQPPLFVDVRVARSVRAPGFNGRAFERTVGAARYRWMDDLGNPGVLDHGSMRIKNPAAAATLLDIAESCAHRSQRVLFYCACEFPGTEERPTCHRTAVAGLALEAAARRKLPIQVVEWPGGEPRSENIQVELSADAFTKVYRGACSIPLPEPVPLAEMAAIPWYSQVTVRRKGAGESESFDVLTGPARYGRGGWYLPIWEDVDPELPRAQVRQKIRELRQEGGYDARLTKL